jgi:hypothetical protein
MADILHTLISSELPGQIANGEPQAINGAGGGLMEYALT